MMNRNYSGMILGVCIALGAGLSAAFDDLGYAVVCYALGAVLSIMCKKKHNKDENKAE